MNFDLSTGVLEAPCFRVRSRCLIRPHTKPRSQLPVLSGALNVEEAADYLRVSRATIWRLLSTSGASASEAEPSFVGWIWILFLSKPSKQSELVGRSFAMTCHCNAAAICVSTLSACDVTLLDLIPGPRASRLYTGRSAGGTFCLINSLTHGFGLTHHHSVWKRRARPHSAATSIPEMCVESPSTSLHKNIFCF
jgi:hypothetical protein